MLAIWGAAALGCLLGAIEPRGAEFHERELGYQAADLARFVTTAALAATLLLGPGILFRELSGRRIGLAFLPLFGIGLLVASGGIAWALSGSVDPRTTCFAILAPALGFLLGGLLAAGPEDMLSAEERGALGLVGLVVGTALARSLWSLGPEGELYEGAISRTLVPEGRPDSRTSYLVTSMVANGEAPYGPVGAELFAPYNFSSRGPLPGIASAPVVLLTGNHPLLGAPDQPWQPYDSHGFMAFRIAMITLSSTALLSVWGLVRRLAGPAAARFALLIGIGTPFIFADLWFTWPKLLAASFVILAGLCVVERRAFRAGLLVSVGYLMHPSALIGLSGLGLIALWPVRGARLLRPQVLVALVLLAGTAIGFEGWKLVNGSHYIQDTFYDYLTQAYPHYEPTIGQWVEFRWNTLANTLIPGYLPLFHSDSVSINVLFGHSPAVVHFFFQPWTGVPFGLGIVFFGLLLSSLWQAFRRWPWPVFATVVVPLVVFAVYWGASITGLLREGMQAWVLVLIAVVAVQQAAAGFPWAASRPIRVILALRPVEVFALAVGATLGTRGINPIGERYVLSDVVAVSAIVVLCGTMIAVIWRDTGALRAAKRAPTSGRSPGTASPAAATPGSP